MRLLLVALWIASVAGQTIIRDKVKGLPRSDNRGRSEGNLFCFTFLRNVADSNQISADMDSRLTIIVTSWLHEEVDIRVSYYPYDQSTTATSDGPSVPLQTRELTVPADGVLTIDDLTRYQQVEVVSYTEESEWFKAIRIETVDPTKSVAVYGMSDNHGTADTFVALPYVTSSDTKDYYYATFSTRTDLSVEGLGSEIRHSHVALSSCNELLPPVNISASISGLELASQIIGVRFFDGRSTRNNIPLHSEGFIITEGVPEYGSFIVTDEGGADLTGLRAVSDHPLGFMTGHECGQIPTANQQCDHLVEQVPPSYTWGYTFFLAPFVDRPAGSLVTVITRYATTFTLTCSSDPGVEYSLDDNEAISTIEIGASDYCSIVSERPIAVMQYAKGFHADETLPGYIAELGDPFQLTIPPVSQYSNNYVFSTNLALLVDPAQDFVNGHYLTITVPSDYYQPSSIFLNDSSAESLGLEWKEIRCSDSSVCGYATTVAVDSGTQEVYHNDSFAGLGVASYGWGSEKSYGFTVAYNMDPIGLPIVSLASATFAVTEGGSVSVEVIRSGDPGVDVAVMLEAEMVAGAQNQAIFGQDLASFSTSIFFAAGQTSAIVLIPTTDDTLVEGSEVFQVTLSRLDTGVVVGMPSQAVVTINDNDQVSGAIVFFDQSSYTVAEPTGMETLLLRSTSPVSTDTTIQFTFTDGNATVLEDTTLTQTVFTATFMAGESTLSLPVGIVNDGVYEGLEGFNVQFAVVNGQMVEADSTRQSALVSITDDEDIPVVTFSNLEFIAIEGDGSVSLSLSLIGASTSAVVVSLTQVDGTAIGGGVDYETVADLSVTFQPGSTLEAVSFAINDDSILEGDENLVVLITGAQIATIGTPSQATVSIFDDDSVVFRFSQDSYPALESDGTVDVVLIIEGQSSMSIDYQVFTVISDTDTAEAEDFTAVSMTFTFPANQLNGMETISISLTQSDGVEATETFSVFFTATSQIAQIDNTSTSVSITDSDVVTVGFRDPSYMVVESNPVVVLTLEKSGQTEFNVTVMFSTTFQTATGADPSCIGSVANSDDSWSATYIVNGEKVDFHVAAMTEGWVAIGFSTNLLMVGSDVIVGAASTDGTMSYVSDRYASQYSAPSVDSSQDIEMATAVESDGASAISFSRPFAASDNNDLPVNSSYILWAYGDFESSFDPNDPTSITYHQLTRGSLSNPIPGSASQCVGDYITTIQEVTFGPNEVSQTISIPINDDGTYEMSEIFLGSLSLVSDPSQASLSRGSTEVFITDDSDNPVLSINPPAYTVNEADMQVMICAELSNPSQVELVYLVQSTNGTALAGEDYAADTIPGLITFAPLNTRQCFNVSIVNDAFAELQEQFTISFQRAGEATITTQIDIVDDDVVTFGFSQASYMFSESGGAAIVTLVITGQSSVSISYNVFTFISSSDTAEAEDFTEISSTFTLAAGEAGGEVTISIPLTQDDGDEPSETFGVDFSITSGSAFVQQGTRPASVTISDSDVLIISFKQPSYQVVEGDLIVEVCVVQSVVSAEATVVVLNSVADTATAGSDYNPSSVPSTISIPVGELEECFNVSIIDDTVKELNEAFQIIAVLQGSTTPTVMVDVTILDDDDLAISFEDSSYTVEEDNGSRNVCVVLNTTSSEAVTVMLTSTDGSAMDVSDYDASSIPSTLTISAGDRKRCFEVDIVDDSIYEMDEVFTISAQIQGSSDGSATVEVTIEDDEVLSVRFHLPAYSVREDDGMVNICVEIEPESSHPISIFVFPTEVSARDGLDFRADDFPTVPIVLSPGDVTECLDIRIVNDEVVETSESFIINLLVPDLSLSSVSTVNIEDDDVLSLSFREQSYTVDEDERMLNVCIQLLKIPSVDTVVILDDVPGSAVAGSDYNASSIPSSYFRSIKLPSVTFTVGGASEMCFIVEIVDDETNEVTEAFEITARFESSATSDATTSVTIRDDDDVSVGFELPEYTVMENEGLLSVCVVLSRASSQNLTAVLSVTELTATSGDDYVEGTIPSSILFLPGSTKDCFDVEIVDNNVVEPTEGLLITVGLLGSSDMPVPIPITFLDDDELTISFMQPSYPVEEDDGSLTVCVELGALSLDDTVVILSDEPGTAVRGEDYDQNSFPANITIPAGMADECFSVDIIDDDVNEPQQSFQLTAEIQGSTAQAAITTVTITDDDGINVGFGEPEYEVLENETSIMICVVLSRISMDPITVDLTVLETGSAVADSDYVESSIPGMFIISPEMMEMCFPLGVIDDDLGEPTETLHLSVVIQGSTDLPATTVVRIVDDDAVSISFEEPSYRVVEQNRMLMVCIVLNVASSQNLTLTLETVPGSASPGTEYVADSIPSSFDIPARMIQGCFMIELLDDIVYEPQEEFGINARLEGSMLPDATTTVIIDDNEVIEVSFRNTPYVVNEQDEVVEVCIQLSVASSQNTTILLSHAAVTATQGDDYVASTIPPSVTIAAGDTDHCFMVAIVNDAVNEPTEESFIIIAQIEGSTTPGSSESVTIVDDDEVAFRFKDPSYSVNENDGFEEVCVVLNTTSTQILIVDLMGSEGSATAGDDYSASSIPDDLTFAPGSDEECFNVTVVADDIDEQSETFEISITRQGSSVAEATTEVTIEDGNTLSISFREPSYTIMESVGTVTVCVELNVASSQNITIALDDIADSATAGSDYVEGSIPATVDIMAGKKDGCFDVAIINDAKNEPQERFEITASLPGSTSPDATVGVVINDDDGLNVFFNSSMYVVNEGDGSVEVCVDLSTTSSEEVTVLLEDIDQSATAGNDYDASTIPLSVTFTPGSRQDCFNVDIIDDDVSEPNQNFFISVQIEGSSDTPVTTQITIEDNDDLSVSFKLPEYSVNENDGSVRVCVVLSTTSSEMVTVQLSSTAGSAVAGDDYDATGITQTLTFQPMSTEECFNVGITDDVINELTETFTISAQLDGSSDPPATTTVRIVDDDSLTARFELEMYTVNEDDAMIRVCVLLSTNSSEIITIDLSASDGSAVAGDDYNITSIPQMLIFQPQTMRECFYVEIVDDAVNELLETFTISAVLEGSSDPSATTIRIEDNDELTIRFEQPSYDVNEGDGIVLVCVEIDPQSSEPVTLNVAATSGSATDGLDYAGLPQLDVVVNPGETRKCFNITIVDDRIIEGPEDIEISVQSDRTSGTITTNITITDNDDAVIGGPMVQIRESLGMVEICIGFEDSNVVAGFPIDIELQLTAGTAGVNDFDSQEKIVTIPEGESGACTEVGITRDNQPEGSESFFVETNVLGDAPGVVAGDQIVVVITDVPENATECIVRSPLVVVPNKLPGSTSFVSYNFKGTCEHVLTTPCDSDEYNIVGDFLQTDLSMGRVGIQIPSDGYNAIIDEDFNLIEEGTRPVGVAVSESENRTEIILNDDMGSLIVSIVRTNSSIVISSAVDGGQLCGLCGSLNGSLISSDGVQVTDVMDRMQVESFSSSWLVEPSEQILRDDRRECAVIMSDTVIGDPLLQAPLWIQNEDVTRSLCYEVHGRSDAYFNLVSDECVLVNALYSAIEDLNVVSEIGIRAVEQSEQACTGVRVRQVGDACVTTVTINDIEMPLNVTEEITHNGITIRQQNSYRVRVSVPNCEQVSLIMWATCEMNDGLPMMRFNISRGVNLRPTSHGLLGQFWNIPVEAVKLTDPELLRSVPVEYNLDQLYLVTVKPESSSERTFLGELFDRHWDSYKSPCLYVGNSQAGSSAELEGYSDSVIEGDYSDYIISGRFEEDFIYNKFDNQRCLAPTTPPPTVATDDIE